MKIRRKLPKAPPTAPPAYVVGYSGPIPTGQELQAWFDLEYGGPLKWKTTEQDIALCTHGPWPALLRLSLSKEETDRWHRQLNWRHESAGTILPAGPKPSSDTVLHMARLARGFTLLTDGTAFDVGTQTYLNPSDYLDRRFELFTMSDHVTVANGDAPDRSRDWFFTRGLNKFGLDDLETFRPLGLPHAPVIEALLGIAEEMIRMGRAPNVGTDLPIPSLSFTVRVTRHRTVALPDGTLILREVEWGRDYV